MIYEEIVMLQTVCLHTMHTSAMFSRAVQMRAFVTMAYVPGVCGTRDIWGESMQAQGAWSDWTARTRAHSRRQHFRTHNTWSESC